MSMLTDVFISLANAVRKLLGTSGKYTPAQAISAIDSIVNRGESQTAGGVAQSGDADYISLIKIPPGYYPPSSNTWAPEIKAAKSNFGDAAAGEVLSGKKFTSTAGLKANGTMPNRTVKSGNAVGVSSQYPNVPVWPNASSHVITNTDNVTRLMLAPPEGYYGANGTGYVGKPMTDFGNAEDGMVLNGATYTSKYGLARTGKLKDNGGQTWVWYDEFGHATYTYSSGERKNMQYVSVSEDMYIDSSSRIILGHYDDAANSIVEGNNVFGVSGNWYENSTYDFGETDGGAVDLGRTNTYRWVRATKVVDWSRKHIDGYAVSGSTVTDTSEAYIYYLPIGTYCAICVNNSKNVKNLAVQAADGFTISVLQNGPFYGDGTDGAYGWYRIFRVTTDMTSVHIFANVQVKVIRLLAFTI